MTVVDRIIVPAKPERLVAGAASRTQVHLKWDPVCGANITNDGYVVLRAEGPNSSNIFEQIAEISGCGNFAYADSGLSPGTTYYYRVKAIWSGVSSEYSEVVTVTTPADVSSPLNATKQWDKRFGGTGVDQLTASIKTSDGGYLLAGTTESGAGGDISQPGRGGNDYWIVKTDASGNALWNKRYGGSADDELYAAVATSDGGFLLAGTSASPVSGDKSSAGKGGKDYWIVKIDASGTKQWDKAFGGSGVDELRSVLATADGGSILAGYSSSAISGDKSEGSRGGMDYWVVKITSSGTRQWDKRFGGSQDDQLSRIIATSDGGYLLGGTSQSGKDGDKSEDSRDALDGYPNGDYWVVKITSSGTKQWDKRFGGNYSDQMTALVQSADGGYLLGGFSNSEQSGDKTSDALREQDPECGEPLGSTRYTYWVVKINSQGSKQWDRAYSGWAWGENQNSYLSDMVATPDGGFLIGGSSANNAGQDKSEGSRGESIRTDCGGYPDFRFFHSSDYWMIKVSATGAKEWDKTLGGYESDYLSTLLYNADGSILLAGTSTSNADGDKTESHRGNGDFWVVKTHASQSTALQVSSLTLINADSDQDVKNLSNSDQINYASLGTKNINIRATTTPATVGSVVFEVDGVVVRKENSAPYTIGGDGGWGKYDAWTLSAGNHTIKATPYSGRDGSGMAGQAFSVTVTVRDYGLCTASGSILWEYWQNVSGNTVASIPVNTTPSGSRQLSKFESPVNFADTYGSRIRGYICAPQTGNYLFFIQGDDQVELWLSPDDNPANKQKIASAQYTWSWEGQANQQSAPIALVAGRRYYIEALHKEGSGGDKVAVGWILPNGSAERPIQGSRLSPFVPANARLGEQEVTVSVSVFPNPFTSKITLELPLSEGAVGIQLVDGIGRSYYQQQHQVSNKQVEVELPASQMASGMYYLKVQGNNLPMQVLKITKQ